MITIRPFVQSDSVRLVEILRINGQYDYPAIDGPEAMDRVAACDAAIFLVAEEAGQVQGLIRAVYDGSRALIHLLSVHPSTQRKGIGSTLVAAMEKELNRRGAPTVSVTVAEDSAGFWEKQGFDRSPVHLMLKTNIMDTSR